MSVEIAKQFEDSAGRRISIEGHSCHRWDPRQNNTEFVFAVRLAHLNNQLARTDLYVDPTRVPTPGVSAVAAFTRTSGGISGPYYSKKLINYSESIPAFYTVLEIDDTMDPLHSESILVLERKKKSSQGSVAGHLKTKRRRKVVKEQKRNL